MYCATNDSLNESFDLISKDQASLDLMRKCNSLIKKPQALEEGLSLLGQIDFDDLTSGGLRMYYRYIKGKYYSRKFRISIQKDIKLLERANDQFDDIPRIAHEYGIKPRKEQYLFVRINTKYQLSKLHKGEMAIRFFNHAKCLSDHSMRIYQDTSGSFTWIRDQLKTYSKFLSQSHKLSIK